VLVSRSAALGGEPVNALGALALIAGSLCWAIATILSRKASLPSSKTVSSGAQMLAGGIGLALTSAALGEFRGFRPLSISRAAWFALAYLVVAGSIVAFTAYTWLIHHESPTKVGTYAYVNPVVAVLLGYFLADELLGPRTILGTLLVFVSVVLITTARAKKPAPAVSSETPAKAAS
jgi:drug/metabolite transporter (DMT)-like permease